MGQLALGVRSLLIRLAIFFVMAILLAWALGGTLWPRPVTAQAMSITSGGQTWSWVARITSYSEPSLTWILSCDTEHVDTVHREGWVEATGFITGSAGIFTAARDPEQGWVILALASDGGYSIVGTSDSRTDADADLLDRRSDS